jgi:hypothetical protein
MAGGADELAKCDTGLGDPSEGDGAKKPANPVPIEATFLRLFPSATE